MRKLKPRPCRRRLNLLEPGIAVCKGIGVLALLIAGFFVMGCKRLAAILMGFLAAVLVIFFVLLCLEQHQDRVLCERELAEDAAREKEKRLY